VIHADLVRSTGGERRADRASPRFALAFARDEDAATMIEYAMMLMLIALACLVAVRLLGANTSAFFADAAARVTAAGS
jgi:Flp pilus assembly pilin Flp